MHLTELLEAKLDVDSDETELDDVYTAVSERTILTVAPISSISPISSPSPTIL